MLQNLIGEILIKYRFNNYLRNYQNKFHIKMSTYLYVSY